MLLFGLLTGLGLGHESHAQAPPPAQAPGELVSRTENRAIHFRHLRIEDGLSQHDVTSILQDSIGFLWFGTEDGLNRYDGHDVRVFKPLPFDTTSLRHPWVVGLAPASGSDLWVATEAGGLSRYDAATESFVPHRSSVTPRTSDDLLTLYQARNGSLWIGTRYDGLFHYAPRTGQVVPYRHAPHDPQGLGDNRITALLEDRRGAVWIGTGIGGLTRLDPETGAMTHYRHDDEDPTRLLGNHVTALLEDRRGRIWVGTSPGGLSRFRPDSNDVVHVRRDKTLVSNFGSESVVSLFEDPSGILWIGTGNGLDRMDPSTGTVHSYRHDPTDPTSLRPGAVRSMYLDRSGVFWVGTSNGVSSFVWNAPPFRHLGSDPDDPNTLLDPDVWSIYEDRDGMLWVGTATGLHRVDREVGSVTRFRVDPTDPAALASGGVHSIYEDRAGTFWVGTRTGGLHRFDRASGRVVERFVYDPTDPTQLKTDTPWLLVEDRQERFWITSGGRGCLSQMDPTTRTFEPYCHDPDDPNTPAYDIAHDLVELSSGALWIGTWGGGLDRFDPDAGTFTHHRHDPTDPTTLASNFILALHADARGILWLGLYGAGLDRFDPATGAVTHFTTATSDLPNDIVLSIEEDEAGDLWLSTYRGLARFSPTTGEVQTYGLEDGLQDLEFNSNASFRAPDGELFFGGINGVTAFFPDRIQDNLVPPPVVLTGLHIRGQPVSIGEDTPLQKALPFTRTLTLQHDQRDVAITFAALHYANRAHNRYRYRLESYDAIWHEPGPERTATYTNLDPGTYTFRVQAANGDGVWNEQGATLAIRVAPPAWQTWWAYGLYAVLVGGLLYGIRRYEMGRLQLKNRLELERVEAEQLRDLDRAKSQFFANVSHEFRTPLTLTIGPLEDLRGGLYGALDDEVETQVHLALRNARRVLRLINELMDTSKLEAGQLKLRPQRGDLTAFLRRVARVYEPLAERTQIAFHRDLPDAPMPVWFDPDQLEKVVTNLLSNAFKFTPDGGSIRLSLRVSSGDPDAEHVVIEVRDTGPGIPPDERDRIFERFYQGSSSDARMQPGTGIGLALAWELVHLHGGTLEVDSEEDFGSTFTVRLPIRQDDGAQTERDDLRDNRSAPVASAAAVTAPRVPTTAPDTNRAGPLDADETTILVVEDHAEMRAYIRTHLRDHYRVVEAADGNEGLATARAVLPDLIVSDVMMPGMDGRSLCQAVKQDRDLAYVPVILLTAKATREDKLEGLSEGADDYLTKPFDVEELRVRIDNLIASRQHLRDRFRAAAPELHASTVDTVSSDAAFLERVRLVIEGRLGDEDFNVTALAEDVGLSRVHLYRRLRELIDLSPSTLLRTIRLERAAQLLVQEAASISEIAYGVGFKSVSHFSRSFREHYGCTPTEYAARSADEH